MSKPSTPPEANLAMFLDGLKDSELFKGGGACSHASQSGEGLGPKAAQAKAAAESVEDVKQKAIKRQEDIDRLQAVYDHEVSRLIQSSSSKVAFQALSVCVEAQPLLSLVESSFAGLSGMLAAATLTLAATDGRNDDIDMQPDKELTVEAVARAYTRSLEGLPDDESEAKKQKFVEYIEQERQVLPPQAALRHDLLRPQPAGGLRQGITAFIPCQDFGWRRTFSSSVTSKNKLDNSHGQRHRRGNLDS